VSDVLTQLSEDMAAVVAAAEPSVVRVEARRRIPASGVAWKEKGIVVTAHHTVQQEKDIGVVGQAGERWEAELVGRDPSTDLAVLRLKSGEVTPAEWADPESVRVGHLVLAVGRPGRGLQATLGVVSAMGDSWRTPMGGRVERYLQTDVVMYPGFSGGPLLGADRSVIGVNTSALVRGVSLTLPTSTVARVTADLLEHGRIRRGYLGVSAQAARLPDELAESLGQETGLLLASVEPESPAAAGGLMLGDTLLSMDELPLRHLDDLLSALAERAGRKAGVKFLRGGDIQSLQIAIGERE
jgi:S1-C subfamily serine protease